MPLKSDASQVLVDPALFAGGFVEPGQPLPVPDPGLRLTPASEQAAQAAAEVARLAEVVRTMPPPETCPDGHQNPSGQKFCGECGQSIQALPKWRCGHDNPEQHKFCGECGQPAYAPPVAGAGLMAELEARVDLPAEWGRPKPESLLTENEKVQRQRAHAEAVRLGASLPNPVFEPVSPTAPQQVIHLIEDGLTFAGLTWYRGQEIRLTVGSERWKQAQAWINQTDFEQVERYGSIKFRPGPWPGLSYADALKQQQHPLSALDKTKAKAGVKAALPDEDALHRAQQAEERRRGAVPAPIG
jgi:hypothetical protein